MQILSSWMTKLDESTSELQNVSFLLNVVLFYKMVELVPCCYSLIFLLLGRKYLPRPTSVCKNSWQCRSIFSLFTIHSTITLCISRWTSVIFFLFCGLKRERDMRKRNIWTCFLFSQKFWGFEKLKHDEGILRIELGTLRLYSLPGDGRE